MHSPLVSVRSTVRPLPNSSASHAGKSPPTMSPSRVASAHRATRPSAVESSRRAGRVASASSKFNRQNSSRALTNDHLLTFLPKVRIRPVQLLIQLPLQVAGIGADPHRHGSSAPTEWPAQRSPGLADAGARPPPAAARRPARAERTPQLRARRIVAAGAAVRLPRPAAGPAGRAPRPARPAKSPAEPPAVPPPTPSAASKRDAPRLDDLPGGCSPAPSACRTAGPQRQPARAIAQAMAIASCPGEALRSASNARAAANRPHRLFVTRPRSRQQQGLRQAAR